MKLIVQRPMTQTHDSLTALEAQFAADHLELSPEAQDLLFRDARTANAFTDEPVSEEQVRAIYDLVKWAPTSMNNQPLRIVLVRTPEARGRLVEQMGGNNKAKTSTAPLVAILAADTDFHDELGKVFPHFEGAREVREDLAELVVEVGVGGQDRHQGSGGGLGLVVAAHLLDQASAGLGGAHEDDPQRLVVHRGRRPLDQVVDRAHLLLG